MSTNRKPVWQWIVACAIALPVLYVASVAPALILREKLGEDALVSDVIIAFYYPVWWLLEACPEFLLFMNWYSGLWGFH